MQFSISPEYRKKIRLIIATPALRGICTTTYTESLIRLVAECIRLGIAFAPVFKPNIGELVLSRNMIANECLNDGATHLLFIDDDIGFRAPDVMAMLAAVGDGTKYGILGAAYARKTTEATTTFTPLPDREFIAGEGPIEVAALGTGLMLIHCDVLRRIAEALPKNVCRYEFTEKPLHLFFNAGPDNGEYVTEDYWFCRRAHESGISVWLAPWVQADHVGTQIYKHPPFDGNLRLKAKPPSRSS